MTLLSYYSKQAPKVDLKEELPVAKFVLSRAKLTKPEGVTLKLWLELLITEGLRLHTGKLQRFTQPMTPSEVSLSVRTKVIEAQPEHSENLGQFTSHLISIALDATLKERHGEQNSN